VQRHDHASRGGCQRNHASQVWVMMGHHRANAVPTRSAGDQHGRPRRRDAVRSVSARLVENDRHPCPKDDACGSAPVKNEAAWPACCRRSRSGTRGCRPDPPLAKQALFSGGLAADRIVEGQPVHPPARRWICPARHLAQRLPASRRSQFGVHRSTADSMPHEASRCP